MGGAGCFGGMNLKLKVESLCVLQKCISNQIISKHFVAITVNTSSLSIIVNPWASEAFMKQLNRKKWNSESLTSLEASEVF